MSKILTFMLAEVACCGIYRIVPAGQFGGGENVVTQFHELHVTSSHVIEGLFVGLPVNGVHGGGGPGVAALDLTS